MKAGATPPQFSGGARPCRRASHDRRGAQDNSDVNISMLLDPDRCPRVARLQGENPPPGPGEKNVFGDGGGDDVIRHEGYACEK